MSQQSLIFALTLIKVLFKTISILGYCLYICIINTWVISLILIASSSGLRMVSGPTNLVSTLRTIPICYVNWSLYITNSWLLSSIKYLATRSAESSSINKKGSLRIVNIIPLESFRYILKFYFTWFLILIIK